MKLKDIKPSADLLFGNIQENILNPQRKLTLAELEIVADVDNRERMTVYEWLQVVTMYPAELYELGEQRNAASIKATGRTVLEQAIWESDQEILMENLGRVGGQQ